ncbi:hypothetical protein LCGC14_1258580 [marine sediment metagenome]|uniref:Uncharacterized protein n=1 Tax=marine sediment metagenome TaxID=412755 RepID=A0A0F9L3U9_9ZZZZ
MAWGMQGVGAMEAIVKTPDDSTLKVQTSPDSLYVDVIINTPYGEGARTVTARITLPKERFGTWLDLASAALEDCKDDQPEGPD